MYTLGSTAVENIVLFYPVYRPAYFFGLQFPAFSFVLTKNVWHPHFDLDRICSTSFGGSA
jgi:hypothetical protein